jgi:hypothetical protein
MTVTADAPPVPDPTGAHHLDGELAAPISDALDAARQWADWAAKQLDAWIRTDAACLNTGPDTPEAAQSLPKLFSTAFIQLAINQSRAYREIAAEERAAVQAGVLVGALPPNLLASRPPAAQFAQDEADAAVRAIEEAGG